MNTKQRAAIREAKRIIKEGKESVARLKGTSEEITQDIWKTLAFVCSGFLWLGAPEITYYIFFGEFLGFGEDFVVTLFLCVYYGMVVGSMGTMIYLLGLQLFTLRDCWKTIRMIQGVINKFQRKLDSVQ